MILIFSQFSKDDNNNNYLSSKEEDNSNNELILYKNSSIDKVAFLYSNLSLCKKETNTIKNT